jgi:hypothetical protein
VSRNMERYVRALRDQVARLEVPQAVEERFGRFRVDPAGFCREVLGVESGTRRNRACSRPHRPLHRLRLRTILASRQSSTSCHRITCIAAHI